MTDTKPKWRTTGSGHFDANGYAIYPVTNGLKKLSHLDHNELESFLASDADRVRRALKSLIDCIELWEKGSDVFLPFGKHMAEAKAALEARDK